MDSEWARNIAIGVTLGPFLAAIREGLPALSHYWTQSEYQTKQPDEAADNVAIRCIINK